METEFRPGLGETMKSTTGKRNIFIGAALAALIVALGVGQSVLHNKADAQGRTVQAPLFEVDPLWPKPLPNHWLLGWTIGLSVDEPDHVWVIHRGSAALHDNEKGSNSIRRSPRAAPARRPSSSSIRRVTWWSLGRTRGLRVAAIESWHHVDYKGNMWIGGNGAKMRRS